MCHVIVTCRSMLWTLLSIATVFSELIAFLSTDWLVGFQRVPDSGSGVSGEAYRPTLGLFGRCVSVGGVMCGPYALSFTEIDSGFWQASAIFLAAGIMLLSITAVTSVLSICIQSIMRKSIFNLCGVLQAVAGLLLILGQLLFAAGWGGKKVQQYCGSGAAAYNPSLCSVGGAFYTALVGTALSFISAVFSAQAEISTSSDKVQEEIEQGKNLVCLL